MEGRLTASDITWLMRRFTSALAYLAAHPEHTLGEVSLLKYLPGRPLVELQSGGSQVPFFLCPAAGASPLSYTVLAHHLGHDRPIFAFQAEDTRRVRSRNHESRAWLVITAVCSAPFSRKARTCWEVGRWGAWWHSRWPSSCGVMVKR